MCEGLGESHQLGPPREMKGKASPSPDCYCVRALCIDSLVPCTKAHILVFRSFIHWVRFSPHNNGTEPRPFSPVIDWSVPEDNCHTPQSLAFLLMAAFPNSPCDTNSAALLCWPWFAPENLWKHLKTSKILLSSIQPTLTVPAHCIVPPVVKRTLHQEVVLRWSQISIICGL